MQMVLQDAYARRVKKITTELCGFIAASGFFLQELSLSSQILSRGYNLIHKCTELLFVKCHSVFQSR